MLGSRAEGLEPRWAAIRRATFTVRGHIRPGDKTKGLRPACSMLLSAAPKVAQSGTRSGADCCASLNRIPYPGPCENRNSKSLTRFVDRPSTNSGWPIRVNVQAGTAIGPWYLMTAPESPCFRPRNPTEALLVSSRLVPSVVRGSRTPPEVQFRLNISGPGASNILSVYASMSGPGMYYLRRTNLDDVVRTTGGRKRHGAV